MLCLLAGLLAWWELRDDGAQLAAASVQKSAPDSAKSETDTPVSGKDRQMEPANAALAPAPVPASPGPKITAGEVKAGPRFKRAYMLSIDKGAVSFLESQDIEGDFATDREQLDGSPGMLRCRLVSATDAVLAEEVLPAPDYVCTVLDHNSKPLTLNPQRPVVFQVRLPRVKGASRLNIYRIIQPGEQPLEGLLASIPLPSS
ncbi:hypothetical protein BGE01nite_34840 [Brevifollis gellanilyticus]|uniref:Uncharacterized protein n=2 Tax=Brevifollis gellanilyticus TaxID=748831 RepID=A0A512MBU3_9BACT|nr:hypothetical protein BGE01nite_34840 [Brevifollis gellanilyticus]